MSEVLGGVTVEVRASTTALDAGFAQAKGKTDAFDKSVADAMRRVENSTKKMADVASASAKRAASSEELFTKSLQDQTVVLGRVAGALDRMAAAQDKVAVSGRRMPRNGKPLRETGEAAGFAAHELANLSFQLNDVVSGLAMGQRPMQVLLQQGGQIAQVLGNRPGGVGAGLRNLVALIPRTAYLLGGLAVGVGVAAKAWYDHSTAMHRFEVAAMGAGRSAGLTARELDRLATSGAASSNITVGAARDLEVALLQTGRVGGEVFGKLIAVQKRWALATGQDTEKATADLAAMFADPEKGAERLDRVLGGLDGATKRYIRTLVEQNRLTEAQTVLATAMERSLTGAAKSAGGLQGALDGLVGGMSRAWNAAGRLISQLERLNAIQKGGIAAVRDAEGKAEARQVGATILAQANRASTAAAAVTDRLSPDRAARQELENQRVVLQEGVRANTFIGDRAEAARNQAALDKVIRAQQTYLDQADKKHRLDQLELRDAQAKTPAQKAAVAAERERVQAAGEAVTQAEVNTRASDAAAQARARAAAAGDKAGASLAREAAAMEASTKGARDLAAAYLEGNDAAFVAESRRKALTEATRKGVDTESRARRQLALDVAEQGVAAAKLVASTRDQVQAQRAANDSVIEGLQSSAQAERQMQQEATLRPLLAAHAAAEGKAKDDLASSIAQLRKEYALLNEQMGIAALAAEQEDLGEQAALRSKEATLLAAGNRERDRQIAQLQAIQRLLRLGISPTSADGKSYIASRVGDADAANDMDAKRAMADTTRQVEAQRVALAADAQVFGMTYKQASAFRYEQERLADATAKGVDLTDQQKDALHGLAQRYGEAADGARKLAESQRAAAEASNYLADSVANSLIDVATGSAKAGEAVRALAKDLLRAQLRGVLTGDGPLAGIMGTSQSAGPGQPNGGLLSQLFGKLLGVGKGAAAPTGAANDPVYVQQAGGVGGGGGLFGVRNDPTSGVFNLAGGGGGDLQDMIDAADGWAARLEDVFAANTGGGFLGALKGLFSSGLGGLGSLLGGGGPAAAGGGLGGGLGALAGTLLASVAHGGLAAGSTSTGRSRAVPAGIYLNAPRLHAGFEPDEFPAILQRGERVQSRAQVAANGNRRDAPIIINVHGVRDFAGFERNDRQIGRGYKQRFSLS